jgi:hypothetical protein
LEQDDFGSSHRHEAHGIGEAGPFLASAPYPASRVQPDGASLAVSGGPTAPLNLRVVP